MTLKKTSVHNEETADQISRLSEELIPKPRTQWRMIPKAFLQWLSQLASLEAHEANRTEKHKTGNLPTLNKSLNFKKVFSILPVTVLL